MQYNPQALQKIEAGISGILDGIRALAGALKCGLCCTGCIADRSNSSAKANR